MTSDQTWLPFAEHDARQATIACDDVLAWAEKYDGPPMHALIADPPYEISFMSRKWDATGIAFKPDTWKALAQHLLPGAFGMCFASSRGWHRLACAIEDAGLRIHPSIFGWLTGQSFPKASRIDSQVDAGVVRSRASIKFADAYDNAVKNSPYSHSDIDRHLGIKSSSCYWVRTDDRAGLPPRHHWEQVRELLQLDPALERLYDEAEASEREILGPHPNARATSGSIEICKKNGSGVLTAPATPLAAIWEGYRYGGQILKNALEPIIVFQKPYSGRSVQSITETGAGALWIEGGRVGAAPDDINVRTHAAENRQMNNFGGGMDHRKPRPHTTPAGRWPANFCLLHTEQCIRVGERQVKGGIAYGQNASAGSVYGNGAGLISQPKGDETRGYTDATGHETVAAYRCAPGCVVAALDAQAGERVDRNSPRGIVAHDHGYHRDGQGSWHPGYSGEVGGPSRFYHVSDWSLDAAERLAQASPVFYSAKVSRRERDAGLDGMPLRRAKSTGWSGDSMPERRDTRPGRMNQERPEPLARNSHPTVKPLKLCQWLATLLLPPAAYAPRRLLVPFSGTSSEMVGAMLAGWEEVLGIESDPGYVEIGRARISYWTGWKASTSAENQSSEVHATPKTCDKKRRVKRDLTDDLRQQNLGGNLIDG